jgi:hypothetical protein
MGLSPGFRMAAERSRTGVRAEADRFAYEPQRPGAQSVGQCTGVGNGLHLSGSCPFVDGGRLRLSELALGAGIYLDLPVRSYRPPRPPFLLDPSRLRLPRSTAMPPVEVGYLSPIDRAAWSQSRRGLTQGDCK